MGKVRIARLGLQGDGIADDGSFVPFTLPGELVDTSEPLRILEESPDRIAPVCQHFESCGGCSLQHASDAFLEKWKAEIVRRALLAQGVESDIRPVLTSPPASRRRAVFAGHRTKKTVQIGFHGRGSDQIINLQECALILPQMLELRPAFEALTTAGASRKAHLRISVMASETGWDIDVSDGKPLNGELRQTLAEIARTYDLARLSWEGDTIAMAHAPTINFGTAVVTPPPGAFVQATMRAQMDLINAVNEAIHGAVRVADLFAGCGTFALPISEYAEVHAVEGDASMLLALDAGWRGTPGLKAITTETRDLFRRPLHAEELRKFDAAVIDPPRAGAEAQMRTLCDAEVPIIASVSCNPLSFARDAKILVSGGFNLDWVQVIDQFRWSGHVEIVARFSR